MDEGTREYMRNIPYRNDSLFWAIIAIFGVLISVTTILSISNMNALKTLKNRQESPIFEQFEEYVDTIDVQDFYFGTGFQLAKYNINWDNHDYIVYYNLKHIDGVWKAKVLNIVHDPDCSCEDRRDYLYDILDAITTDYD